MARLNANAHSLESLSGLDQQPMQYHIVFKCLFVLPYVCHIVYLYCQNCISFTFVILSFLLCCCQNLLSRMKLCWEKLFFPKELFFFDCVDIFPACKDICWMDFFSLIVYFSFSLSLSLCVFLFDCVDICPSVQGYLLDGLSFGFGQRT